MAKNDGDWFQRSISNGLIATIAWAALLTVYCTFRALKVEAPALDQAFLLLTGGWVGMLTLAQSNKNKKVEEDVEILKKAINQGDTDVG